VRSVLREVLARRLEDAPPPRVVDHDAFLAGFSAAARRFGDALLCLDPEESDRLTRSGVDWPIASKLCEMWRVVALVELPDGADLEPLVRECYRTGDTGERRAVLRALPLLREPERFVALAVDACRTSVLPIFEAACCENPYPARHFPELHWNQMILKAVFLGVPLNRVIGLPGRLGPEIERMANDYASERRAAGRDVPEDLKLLVRSGR